MPPLEGIRVVRSKIHGYGGVVTRPFAKGEIICYGEGVIYDADAEFDDTYALILDEDLSPTGEAVFYDLVCQTRWFNHSCEPNAEVCLEWDGKSDSMKAWWVAMRDIAVGEEITYDYAFAAEVAEPCYCGTPSCRGLIVDLDPDNLAELPDELRAKLRIPGRAAS
jgi:hypothetical protein